MNNILNVKNLFLPLVRHMQELKKQGTSLNYDLIKIRSNLKRSKNPLYYSSFTTEQRFYVNKLNAYLLEHTAENADGLGLNSYISDHRTDGAIVSILQDYFSRLFSDIKINTPELLFVFEAVIEVGGYQGIMSLLDEIGDRTSTLSHDKFYTELGVNDLGVRQITTCPFERSATNIDSSINVENGFELSYEEIVQVIDHICCEIHVAKSEIETMLSS